MAPIKTFKANNLLCNRSFCCKVERFHLCCGRGGGGSLTFSTTLNAISIRGSYLCLKKAEKKDPH